MDRSSPIETPQCDLHSKHAIVQKQSAIGLWYDQYFRPMDSIARVWLNRQRTISIKPILKDSRKQHSVPNRCKNQRGETIAPGIGAPSSTLLRLTDRRQDSLQAVEALFITQGPDLN